jgi:SDR family mycofactocin-dependent oxidoreductase
MTRDLSEGPDGKRLKVLQHNDFKAYQRSDGGSAMGRVAGKVALISGAARGQGRSHAQLLAAEGADIIAVDICADIASNEYPLSRPEDLDETARLVEKEGQRAYTEIADVRDRTALSAAIDRGVAEFGRLDVVVANAGIAPLTAGSGIEAFVDAIDVDLIGVLNLVHASVKHLSAGASVVITGSMAAALAAANTGGIDAGSGGAGYGFAKQVVAHYVNDLALQMAPKSIRVNGVHPTNVNTDMLHSAPMYRAFRPDLTDPTREDAELVFPVLQAMPIPYVEPEDISELVLFLASDAARYVTGQQIAVDAGCGVKARTWRGL